MASAYEIELGKKNFRSNVVIKLIGQYFAIHQPDSGLIIPSPFDKSVKSIIVNPTQVDLLRANQTIANYSFRLLDKDESITALIKERANAFSGQEVEIYVGRITGSFDFADYFKLPTVKVKQISHSENAYYFSCSEITDRMQKGVFNLAGKLEDAILAATSTFTLVNDTTNWPVSGTGKLEDEFFSWSGKDDSLRELTGVLRGLKGTDAVDHDAGTDISWVYDVTENPLNILLKLLISGGGGGVYDVYEDGLGIDQNLVDITEIESIRDAIFFGEQFSYSLYDIDDCLQFIEDEILLGCNLRLITSNAGKISIAVLDQSVFGTSLMSIDETTISAYPSWEVTDDDIQNVIEFQWDWDEGTQNFLQLSTYKNQDSIDVNGEREAYQVALKGPRVALDGQTIIDDRSDRFLQRFASSNPKISLKTQIDTHIAELGSKVLVQSSQIPSNTGTLEFATELEVISRGINFETGDVTLKVAFTSYSDIRKCYIAPSDIAITIVDQRTVIVAAGRGDAYSLGWKMRLWDIVGISYTVDSVNIIESIAGDKITFVNDWVTLLTAGNFRIKFADYDDATIDQRRYCFISDSGNDFPDGSSTYRITF